MLKSDFPAVPLLVVPLLAAGCLLVSAQQAERRDEIPATPSAQITLPGGQRGDGARRLDAPVEGSLQNPQWSPRGDALLFTRFRNGYNVEPADLLVVDLSSGETRVLVADGSGNVNLPGSSWNPLTGKIAFSSSREPHDEIYLVDERGSPGDEVRITDRAGLAAYEPSFSPDGEWVVFESHALEVEEAGVLVKYRIDGTASYQALTDPEADCRQPNWSPAGDRIIYQRLSGGQWDLWTINSDGTDPRQLTNGAGDETDASFSPDGAWVVYSSDDARLEFTNLFLLPASGGAPVRLTRYAGYDGAPSWDRDGKRIAFESSPGDPEDSAGTALWIIDVPPLDP